MLRTRIRYITIIDGGKRWNLARALLRSRELVVRAGNISIVRLFLPALLVLGHRIAASSKTHEAYAIVRARSRANANARSAVHSARRLDEHQRRTMPLSLHVQLSKLLRTRQRRTVGLKERASHGP